MENITLNTELIKNKKDFSLSNFKNKLASRLEMEGEWEVGIRTISFTNSLLTLQRKNFISFRFWDVTERILPFQIEMKKMFYKDIKKLINAINKKIETTETRVKANNNYLLFKLPRFAFDENTDFVYIKLSDYKNSLVYPILSEELNKILGFKQNYIENEKSRKFAEYNLEYNNSTNKSLYLPPIPTQSESLFWGNNVYELFGSRHSLFIHSNLVKHSFYGELYSPLLGFVEIPYSSKFGEQIVWNYSNPLYIPLASHTIDSIDIEIKDENNRFVEFEHGRVIIVLHFRKKQ